MNITRMISTALMRQTITPRIIFKMDACEWDGDGLIIPFVDIFLGTVDLIEQHADYYYPLVYSYVDKHSRAVVTLSPHGVPESAGDIMSVLKTLGEGVHEPA